jgi:hypothetical protein
MIISLKRTEPCSTCPAQRAFLFEVKHRGNGGASEFRIANDTAQIDQAYVVNSERTAIVGRVQSSTSILNLVDVNTGKLLDEFWCFDPSISPSNRFVAYAKVFPLHFVPAVSYEYLIYDLTVTPEENRTPPNRGRMGDRYDVGWPVYPESLSNSPGDNILSDQTVAHLISSDGFFWLGQTDIVAFVDRWQGANNLIIADVSRGAHEPKVGVHLLDGGKIVDMAGCRKKVAPSDFDNWSKDPASFVSVTNITLAGANPPRLRITLAPHPCLASNTVEVPLDVRLPSKLRKPGTDGTLY